LSLRSLYWTGSLKIVTNKLAKHKLDLMAVQKVRWDNSGSLPADGNTLFYGNANCHLGTGFSCIRK